MNLDMKDIKHINLIFFLIEFFILMGSCIYFNGASATICLLLILFGICALFLFWHVNGNLMEKYPQACRFTQVVLFIIVAMSNGYLIQKPNLMFCFFTLQQICFLFYLDKKIIKLQSATMFLITAILFILGKLSYITSIGTFEYCISIFCTFGICWLLLTIIDILNFRSRQAMEQETSLDDLLKVVEAKCDEARHATKTKSVFLSNMSHEIRTPINVVIGMNEMILRESSEENIVEYATNIENSSQMLLTLINDILDFSKIESGKMELVPVEYGLNSILCDCVNMAKSRAEKKGLSFQIESNPDIPNGLFGDEIRIKQILTNLLTNAIKYTDQGTVTLSIDYSPKGAEYISLKFAVSDTGKGIREEDKDKLFSTFQRVDEKSNRNIEGTGLGLPITKSFVDMMKGTITVESTYGSGSTFIVEIPQKITDSSPIGDVQNSAKANVSQREKYQESFRAPEARILVVDDNNMNLAVIKQLLKSTQIQVTLATSGKECLALTKKEHFDIILLDHMMPEMDGIETLQELKKDPDNLCMDTPIIALTANAISGVRTMYLEAGFDDYLSKPISGQLLEETLLSYLPKNKIQSESKTEEPVLVSRLVNSNLGLSFCGNRTDIYHDILKMFCRMKNDQIVFLNYALEHKDWSQYQMQLYELKSNTLNIGAKSLSDYIKDMEYSIKSLISDAKDISMSSFKEKHKQLIEKINLVTKECEQLLENL